MKEIIFIIEEDPKGGYNAQGFGYSIFTEGETTEDLKRNINQALRCHFGNEKDIPKIVSLYFVREVVLDSACYRLRSSASNLQG